MALLRAAVFAALFIMAAVSAALAQDITLRSRDGGVELTGTLLGFDGEFYRIETRFGELTVDGSGVNCEGVGCPSLIDYVAEVDISGSATMGRVLMPALIQSFALRGGMTTTREVQDDTHFTYVIRDNGKPVGRFYFHVTNTDQGFDDLLADDADIVMALREIRPAEAKQARAEGLGDMTQANRSRVVALDAMVPITSPSNPVNGLTLTQLAGVLSGRITNWGPLGGADAPITLHLRDGGSGLAQTMQDRLLKPARGTVPEDAVRHDTNAALAEAVARDPFGLGIASFSEIGNTKPLVLTGACGFTLRAARRSIKTEDYPLTAPMFLYVPARRLPKLAREFLTFTRSPMAQIVIRRAGFIDQAPEEVAIDMQGDRFVNAITVAEGEDGLRTLQEMTQALAGMRRLTTSFRFEPGSSRLDAQSRSNVQQLAAAMEAGVYDGREVMFVGFSDGQGPAAPNLRIARKRALAVRTAVQDTAETADLGRIAIGDKGFGEAMPMACDDSSWGREVNRRVEVWVR
ncbi:phosphate ABC transporter substrate-binding/OmpA family protein [Tropicibacter naphthalenivorans]|uniref:Phosphate-binding protein PstS 1 n=1 Tax=Tropicibacter naphthalenivorans TaxID=441103 RepID=A0A0P1GW46_9RHOB|nr:phosphate ABC transporter substrate-binding/OmpA family protein [Tropicibacter naphthalenivorans]CUH79252.1 Phosphate-binding protein PstS 1 precursor [Tropicibacter naphthalenivorans]SMC70885.1 phosphate ABC transporter substrate-binding protein, PhoT family [Tropicibacter naphthalenivorans]